MDLTQTYHFHLVRWRALLLVTLYICGTWFAVEVVFFDWAEGRRRETVTHIVAWLWLFLVPVLVAQMQRIVICWSRPVIELSADGFLDRRASDTLIPWDGIDEVRLQSRTFFRQTPTLLDLHLDAQTMKATPVTLAAKADTILHFRKPGSIMVNTALVDTSAAHIHELANAFRGARKTA